MPDGGAPCGGLGAVVMGGDQCGKALCGVNAEEHRVEEYRIEIRVEKCRADVKMEEYQAEEHLDGEVLGRGWCTGVPGRGLE